MASDSSKISTQASSPTVPSSLLLPTWRPTKLRANSWPLFNIIYSQHPFGFSCLHVNFPFCSLGFKEILFPVGYSPWSYSLASLMFLRKLWPFGVLKPSHPLRLYEDILYHLQLALYWLPSSLWGLSSHPCFTSHPVSLINHSTSSGRWNLIRGWTCQSTCPWWLD